MKRKEYQVTRFRLQQRSIKYSVAKLKTFHRQKKTLLSYGRGLHTLPQSPRFRDKLHI